MPSKQLSIVIVNVFKKKHVSTNIGHIQANKAIKHTIALFISVSNPDIIFTFDKTRVALSLSRLYWLLHFCCVNK